MEIENSKSKGVSIFISNSIQLKYLGVPKIPKQPDL